jgi:hypothetical protein
VHLLHARFFGGAGDIIIIAAERFHQESLLDLRRER